MEHIVGPSTIVLNEGDEGLLSSVLGGGGRRGGRMEAQMG